tara:strand:+ start:135 stop:1097 length:963 start_codon:yes stop_codon:yes gene_type:complete
MIIKTNIIFITGSRRSGTTLLLDLLDAHKDLIVFPTDLRLLYAYYPHYCKPKIPPKKKIQRLRKIIFDAFKKEMKQKKISVPIDVFKWENFFFENLNHKKLNDISYLLNHFIKSFQKFMNKEFKAIVLKETNLEINYFLLKKIFKNFKILRIQRDPRGSISSVKSGFKSHYSKIGDHFEISMLSDILRELIKFEILENINDKRIYTIKYENLVNRKDDTINKICKFLKIKKSSSLFYQSKFAYKYTYKNFLNQKIFDFDKSRLYAWKKILSKNEIIILENLLKKILDKYKYKINFKNSKLDSLSKFYNEFNSKLFYKDKF